MNKIVIIGCGNVGMSYAYALVNQNTSVNELVLIDLDIERIKGEVMDLNHCLAFTPNKIKIKVGDYKDCMDATIVVISAGANQKKGETRLDLINKNSIIFKSIIEKVMENNFKGIFLVATNPLDIMTYLAYKYSNLPSSKVIGSGTSLDTARLRYIVGDKLKVNPKNIHAYVIGEHGDSSFVPWSTAFVGLQSIYDFLDTKELHQICEEVKNAAYEIIDKKGATYYGIGVSLVMITNAILNNENSVITVSGYDIENDVYISTPAIINKYGLKCKIKCKLNEKETINLNKSINVIKDAINKVEKI